MPPGYSGRAAEGKQIRNKYIVLLAIVLVLFWFTYEIRRVIAPFIISVILAYLLHPVINYYHARGYKKGVVVLFLSLICLFIAVETVTFLLPTLMHEMRQLQVRLPEMATQARNLLAKVQDHLVPYYPSLKSKDLPDFAMSKINSFAASIPSHLPMIIGNLFNFLSLYILVPFVTIALLLDADRFSTWLFSLVPSRHTETILSIISEINQVLRDFLHGQAMRLFWLTMITIFGLLYLRVDFALVFGLLAGVFNIIPVLGAWLGALPPILMIIMQGDISLVLKLIILFIGIQVLDNTFISTYYLSTSVNLHFVLVLFVIMVGAEYYGLLGIILAVPVASMIKVVVGILYHDYQYKQKLILQQQQQQISS
ncbi:MAG: AI-2E family transporter [bacterium]|nr:AI-2E family transporter [bacterium]MDD5354460.1 AI-2E family transporter [bacterium]MDD5756351.1 AI-2E family transporter [bacterium]